VDQVLTLDARKVATQTRITGYTAAQMQADVLSDVVTGDLVASLESFVLSDKGGEPVVARRVIDRKVKPRWLPRWLWNSIYVEHVTVEVSVEPLWTYPSADLTVPELGRPVRIPVIDQSMRVWNPQTDDNPFASRQGS
jgi:hypothetical protein